MKNDELQAMKEIDCAKRFLPFYNEANSTNFFKVYKNPLQDEVDVFAEDEEGNSLKIQVTSADHRHVGSFVKNITDRLRGRTRQAKLLVRNYTAADYFLMAVRSKIEKYNKAGARIDDIILLLDDIGNFPKTLFDKRFVEKGRNGLERKFKEVWYVGINDDAYRIL